MRGNTFGKLFSITTFGESHGEALGVVIDGMPAGIDFDPTKLQDDLNRRRPGRLEVTTSRNEADKFEVLSGIFESKTIGTPITIIVRNTNQKSSDYSPEINRPGHADITTSEKFGHKDYRGGGRASGRETLARVIGGFFAKRILPFNVETNAIINQIAHFKGNDIHPESNKEVKDFLLALKKDGNSAGGKISMNVTNPPKSLGEPVFDKLKADLSKAMLSIGSCVGINFGAGEEFAHKLGKDITTDRANFGGIEGGISNGEAINMSLTFRAPSTVGQKALEGRHDPCILPRVLIVVEAMANIVLADHFLRQNAYQITK